MASKAREFDCLLFGGGLAGTVLAWTLSRGGLKVAVIDDPTKSRCSMVAAGLVNPIGGRRLNLAWEAESHIPFAKAFYREIESLSGQTLFHERPIARFFASDDERQLWRAKAGDPRYQQWLANLNSVPLPQLEQIDKRDGFAIQSAGFVEIPSLVNWLRQSLVDYGAYVETAFDYSEIQISTEKVAWRQFAAPIAIFAEGHLATRNPWFSFIPYKPAKGVIGRINSCIQFPDTIVIRKHFLLPKTDNSITVGATYNWEEPDDTPDADGIRELEEFLSETLGNDWSWIETLAGVRPATAGAKPTVGPHPEFPNLYSFNGFGSKGATQIPILAQAICDHLQNRSPLPPEILPERFKKQAKSSRWIAVEIARNRVTQSIQPGDTAIDATTGNGHDTLWLAKAVGKTGNVFALDIQPRALAIAKERLQRSDAIDQTTFIETCHSQLTESVPSSFTPTAVVFNLGYLPDGNKSITTQTATTLDALNQSLALLKPGGIISVVAYPGHAGGDHESMALISWAKELDPTICQTDIVTNPSNPSTSPFVVFIEKAVQITS